MYDTRPVDDTVAIERNGRMVLTVCDHDHDFAKWLCALLNELGRKPLSLLTQKDVEWLKAVKGEPATQVHNG